MMLPVMRKNSWLPEVFDDFLTNGLMQRTNATAPAINVMENETQYIVELAAPGLRKEDFQVHVNEDGNLTIKMEQKNEVKEGNEKTHYLRREFSYSKYEQTLLLPEDVDREGIAARVNDGVLRVDLPKVKKEEQKLFRLIEID